MKCQALRSRCIIETLRCGCSRAQGCLIDTVLEHSCPLMLMGFPWEETRGGGKVLRWLIWVLEENWCHPSNTAFNKR